MSRMWLSAGIGLLILVGVAVLVAVRQAGTAGHDEQASAGPGMPDRSSAELRERPEWSGPDSRPRGAKDSESPETADAEALRRELDGTSSTA